MPRTPNDIETLAYRLTEILRRLNEGEKLAPQALADEFKVNLRTVQRDLNERFAFLELDKKDGLYSANRTRLGMLSFADVQRFASLAGLQGIAPRLTTQFLKDILDSRLQSVLMIRGCSFEDLSHKHQLFEHLKHAAKGYHPISFEYRKTESAKMARSGG